MMPRITTINCVAFLLSLLMFGNYTNGQNEIIECTVRDGEIKIHLVFRKTEQLLANEHLPVWTAKSREETPRRSSVEHKLKPNLVRENIGDFILYHDREKSSAVVLFMRTQTLSGNVDTRYAITGLPLDECNSGVDVGGGYVEYINCESLNSETHLKALDLSMHRDRESVIDLHEPSTFGEVRNKQITSLYVEIMVFVSYDITSILKAADRNLYLAAIVAQHIVHFNAIDMLICKLSTKNIEIRINLAGIVIEDEENAFNFLIPKVGDPHHIDVDLTFDRFLNYGSQNHLTFPQDSFDFFFISTRNELWSTQDEYILDGVSWQPNIYKKRIDRTINRYWPGAVVSFTCEYEYVAASHEIAHLMGVEHDPLNKGWCSRNSQCYGIMQRVGSHCPDCIKWSVESVEDLERYVRRNRDSCYLLNRPRSLHPYDSRMKTLSPLTQCQCYRFSTRTSTCVNKNSDVIPRGGCGQSLVCDRHSAGKILPLPIDGTPCADNGVCWDRTCQPISNVPQSANMIPI